MSHSSYPPFNPEFKLSGRVTSVVADRIQIDQNKTYEFSSSAVRDVRINDLISYSINSAGQIDQLLVLTRNKLADFTDQQKSLANQDQIQILKNWSYFKVLIRDFFLNQNFLECESPTLVDCPGTEPYLHPFSTEIKSGQSRFRKFLPTSPELHLKKLLSKGYGPLFELKTVFRNNEFSDHHMLEFTMLEWYRPYTGLDSIKQDLVDLVEFLSLKMNFYFDEIRQTTMAELFKGLLKFELKPNTTREELLRLAISLNLNVKENESIEDLFTFLFIEKIEPQLPKNKIIILQNYPPFQAAYARLNDLGWADRFEVYWKGLEIANAFHEVNDPDLQLLRMQNDLAIKQKLGFEIFEIDKEFIDLLKFGMPPSGGIALGIERLFMAIFDIENIQKIKTFKY